MNVRYRGGGGGAPFVPVTRGRVDRTPSRKPVKRWIADAGMRPTDVGLIVPAVSLRFTRAAPSSALLSLAENLFSLFQNALPCALLMQA